MTSETARASINAGPTAIGTVELDVVDIERSSAWWRELVGLYVQSADADSVSLGVDGEPLLTLRAGASTSVRGGHTGLYHLAVYLPGEPELAQMLARLVDARVRFSATDHLVAKSLYVSDPDGIGVEIALETPERVRSVSWPESARSPEVIDSDGRRRDPLGPLDLEPLLALARDPDVSEPVSTGTRIGHVHLAVSDLAVAYEYYRDRLGFAPINFAPLVGYGDLGRAESLNHLVALNTWQSAGAKPRPAGMAGMSRFTVRFGSADSLNRALAAVEQLDDELGGHVTEDPDGNVIALALPAALPA